MLLKVEIFCIIACLTGIFMQIRPSCRQIDFNLLESINEFESCEDGEMFYIKPYEEVSFDSYRNVENHLSNVGVGLSCVRTVQIFNLDSNTEIDSLIYLNSLNAEDELFVEIQAFDTVESSFYVVGSVLTTSNDWNEFHAEFNLTIENAKIEIRAYTTADTQLAIEYLHIVNPSKAEAYCRRTTTISTEPPTSPTEPTEPETEPTEPETTETEPETTETEPETTETEPETTETEPETTETEPETTETESETTGTEPETTETETETTEAETEATEPETEGTEPETNPTVTETSSTISETDTTETDTETSPTQIPTDPNNFNEGTVWIVLSFTFFLTTIIAAATLIYVIYLYKSAVVMSKSLMMAPTTHSSLPRLTIANGKGGDHIIVGIENGYTSSVMKSRQF